MHTHTHTHTHSHTHTHTLTHTHMDNRTRERTYLPRAPAALVDGTKTKKSPARGIVMVVMIIAVTDIIMPFDKMKILDTTWNKIILSFIKSMQYDSRLDI